MILLDSIVHSAIDPALALLPPKMDSDKARAMLLAIGLQESRFMYRAQKTNDPNVKGPARGFWQMERGGGVVGVMTHPASKDLAREVCTARNVPFDSHAIHARLESDDVLAAAFARLLLWTDPRPLPGLSSPHSDAWSCYVFNWRPGKPHRDTWDDFNYFARKQVLSAESL